MKGEIRVPPFWRIVPEANSGGEGRQIVVCAGPGWGNGAHETTQLCLQAIAVLSPKGKSFRMLDFGSGSGILSIGAALLGGTADAVEIDEIGIKHARENIRLSQVEDAVRFFRQIPSEQEPYDLVVANILKPVLLEFAPLLAACLSGTGILILSGLVATDAPELTVRYSQLLHGRSPTTYSRGDWRALVWR